MKHLALTLVLIAAASPLLAQGSQPPLIDRNLFYGEIAISGAQISPDGHSLSFLKPYKGTRNIWVKGVDEPFSAARPLSWKCRKTASAGELCGELILFSANGVALLEQRFDASPVGFNIRFELADGARFPIL